MRKTMKTTAILAAMSVMVLGTVATVSAAEQGWEKKGSDWYYNDANGDAYVNKWVQSGGKWYFLGDNGKMAKDKFIDAWESVVTNHDAIHADRSHDSGYNTFYYVNSDGEMVTGWVEVKNVSETSPVNGDKKAWYYFAESGEMYGNEWAFSGEKWYYLDATGKMMSNDLYDGYFLGNSGAMETGWIKVTNSTAKTNLGLAQDSWVYCGTDGKPATAWKKVNGLWYYFGNVSASAASADDTAAASAANGADPATFQMGALGVGDRTMNASTFIQDGSVKDGILNVFYLTNSGAMATSWFKPYRDTSGTWYWADSSGRVRRDGIEKINSKYYYFDFDGACVQSGYYLADGTNLGLANDKAAKEYSEANANDKVYKLGTGTTWLKGVYYNN